MNRRAAHTLVEALVAFGLTLFVATLGIVSWLSMNRAARHEQARIDARLQLRTALDLLRAELQSAACIYAGYQGNFAGHAYQVPDGRTAATPGRADLIFALPENNRVNAVDLWKVVGLSAEPASQTDPGNPQAFDLVLRTVDNVEVHDPARLQSDRLLAGLSTPLNTSVTRFAASLDPADCLADVRLEPFSALLHFTFRIHPREGGRQPDQIERYATEVFLRNQPAMTH